MGVLCVCVTVSVCLASISVVRCIHACLYSNTSPVFLSLFRSVARRSFPVHFVLAVVFLIKIKRCIVCGWDIEKGLGDIMYPFVFQYCFLNF